VRRNPPPTQNLIFSPLSGRLWLEDWRTDDAADLIERPLDADDAIHILSEAFEEEGGRFSQNNRPLFGPDGPVIMEEARCALGHAGSWNWGLPNLTHAYLGVGSLADPRHRLAIFLDRYEAGDPGAINSYLGRAAGKALAEVRQRCTKLGLPQPCDIGNRLFPALPFPHELFGSVNRRDAAKSLRRVGEILSELNSKAVVMSWNHLRRADAVHVVGGGETKLRALWTVLLSASFYHQPLATRRGDSSPLVTHLTTDDSTARALLGAMSELQSDRSVQEFYRELCSNLGLSAAHVATREQ
jgi:hypothetical protein